MAAESHEKFLLIYITCAKGSGPFELIRDFFINKGGVKLLMSPKGNLAERQQSLIININRIQ